MGQLIGTNNLRFDFIRPQDEARWNQLRTFAQTFDHDIPCRKWVAMAYRWNNEWVGYCQIMDTPVIFPALHPEKVSPRIVTEIMKAHIGYAKLNPYQKQEGFVAVPTDPNTKFQPGIMHKLGFNQTGHQLYEIAGD